MRQVDREVDRYLGLLRAKIREQGFTQLEVQHALSWGRSYISQILNRQKCLRYEQVLLILKVIGIDPAAFFAELYGLEGPSGSRLGLRSPQTKASSNGDLDREIGQVKASLESLVGLLLEKRIVTGRDLRASMQESIEGAAE